LGRIEADRGDVEIDPRGRELSYEAAVRLGHRDLHGVRVDGLGVLDVDGAQGDRAAQLVRQDAVQREDDVLGGQGLAVVEGDTLPQLDGPLREIAVGSDRLGQHVFELGVGVELYQRAVQRLQPGAVQVGDALVRVDRVRGPTAGESHLEVA